MRLSRRDMLKAAALSAAAPGIAFAAGEAPKPAQPSLEEKIAARAKEIRLRLDFDGARFSGPGWDFLVAEGAASQFTLLGEEHMTDRIPVLSRELLLALKPAGYERLVLEISAPIAGELDRAAIGGLDAIRKFNTDFPPGPAFYFAKDEAEFLAAARAAFPVSRQLLWGLDYEVSEDRRLIARLKERAPRSAVAAVQALEDASTASWKTWAETHNPQFIFSFAGDPKLIADIRASWPKPDEASGLILDVLQATLETNRLWVENKGWESNERRTRLMRTMLTRYWKAEEARGRAPKAFFKFGASHMARGRDMSECYDVGDLAASIATLGGAKSFHIIAGGAPGGEHGQVIPTDFSLVPTPVDMLEEEGAKFLADVAYSDSATVIDLRVLRAILGYRTAKFDVRSTRILHGFDALVVLPGTKAATML